MPVWLELWLRALVLLLVVLLVLVRVWMTLMPERAVMDSDGSYAGYLPPEEP
jgi:hypothetical protein